MKYTESVLPAIPDALFDRAWQEDDEAAWREIDAISARREVPCRALWAGMQSEKIRIAWYDESHNGNHWLRYIIHRSTRTDGALQISCAEMVDTGARAELIPLSHHTSKTIDDFAREVSEGSAARVICVEWSD